MIVFATSDKGGTGRSVTSCNVVYRMALQGKSSCYVDFDFGSPTAGAIFSVEEFSRGTGSGRGLHAYVKGDVPEPEQVDVWATSDRRRIRTRPTGAGRLTLLPGDRGGGEFPATADRVQRCRELLATLEEEYEFSLVDLSAGRSYALEMTLRALTHAELRNVETRWLVFHRWTKQHIIAASGLVYGEKGILEAGARMGLDPDHLAGSVRFIRTAVLEPDSQQLAGLRPAQYAWLQDCHQTLQMLAANRQVGRSVMLGSVPLDPVLQWREQIITDGDVWNTLIANPETGDAFDDLAKRIVDPGSWEGL